MLSKKMVRFMGLTVLTLTLVWGSVCLQKLEVTEAGGYIEVTRKGLTNKAYGNITTYQPTYEFFWQNTDSEPVVITSDDNWSLVVPPGETTSRSMSRNARYWVEGVESDKYQVIYLDPLQASLIGPDTITIAWGAPEGVTRYEFSYGQAPNYKIATPTTNTYTVNSLTADAEYVFEITAFTSSNMVYRTPQLKVRTKVASSEIEAVAKTANPLTSDELNTPPQAPSSVTAAENAASTSLAPSTHGTSILIRNIEARAETPATGQPMIKVTWNVASSDDGVSGYLVYVDGVSKSVVQKNEFSIPDVTPGKTYNVTVRAYDPKKLLSGQSGKVSYVAKPTEQSATATGTTANTTGAAATSNSVDAVQQIPVSSESTVSTSSTSTNDRSNRTVLIILCSALAALVIGYFVWQYINKRGKAKRVTKETGINDELV